MWMLPSSALPAMPSRMKQRRSCKYPACTLSGRCLEQGPCLLVHVSAVSGADHAFCAGKSIVV